MESGIRNFSIIAHIDHGKSTLADRMLEVTGTISEREMRDQVLDSMDLERERGITIKMQPVRMNYVSEDTTYTLNLIDTPGHIDFSYEVSRALKAVEGAILLVDATQGVQAQTLTTLGMARAQGLTIVPAVSKIDSPLARIDETKIEIAEVIGCDLDDIIEVSGRTGEGVESLLKAVIARIPPPEHIGVEGAFKGLVFDFQYSNHRGVIVYLRGFGGKIEKGTRLRFAVSKKEFNALEVGIFAPREVPVDSLNDGEIGYVVTGIKEAGVAAVGDTLVEASKDTPALPGYELPRPVIWASVYPESQDDFVMLRQSLERLKLSDSSLSFEEEASGILGRGFRCGFLGMLHLEIITERLKREFSLSLVITSPSIEYQVEQKGGIREIIYTASQFPEYGNILSINERFVTVEMLTPAGYIDPLMQLMFDFEAEIQNTDIFGDGRTRFFARMPLRELMRGFFDEVKRVSSGYASLSYEIEEAWYPADVVKLEILINDEAIPAFSKIVSERRVEEEAKRAVEKLSEKLPKQTYKTKIQGAAKGRIIASRTLAAMRKDVTGYLYGGDITRKMKLLEKQKKGKKHRAQFSKANIPHDVFVEMVKGN